MLYIGLDVHSKWMTIKGFNSESGEIFEISRQSNTAESLAKTFSKITEPLYGVMESGTNSWAVYRILEPYFEKLIIVDPATVWGKDIRRGAKTDGRDAMALAMKMYRQELTALYVPDVETQDLRSLERAKIKASREVTRIVNELCSQLRSWGIIVEKSLLSKKGGQFIDEYKTRLPERSLKIFMKWLELLEKAKELEAELEEMVKAEVAADEQCRRLATIPGIGPLTALVVRAEIGDIDRFASAEQLISYCGLAPSVHQSADKIYYGHLNKFCNKYLKYVLVLCAQNACRAKANNPMSQTYWRVALRGKNNAKIAVARQLTRVIHSMIKHKVDWDPCKITDRRGSPTLAATL